MAEGRRHKVGEKGKRSESKELFEFKFKINDWPIASETLFLVILPVAEPTASTLDTSC